MDGWLDGWTDGWMDGWMLERVNGSMDEPKLGNRGWARVDSSAHKDYEVMPWETFQDDASAWSLFLQSQGIDERARANVFAIYNFSDYGKQEALKVVAEVIRLGGSNLIRNQSAKVQSMVNHAWTKVLQYEQH